MVLERTNKDAKQVKLMPVTQKQIAEQLGVSHQLVGLALNGHPRVSEETRAKIKETAAELGYGAHSNQNARSLAALRHGKRTRTGIIALLMPSTGQESLRSIPFFAPMLDGIETEADARTYDLILCSHHREGLPRLIETCGVDGVISISGRAIERLIELRLPVVNLNWYHPATHSVRPDEQEGIRQTTQYLIDAGHRRIAFLGHPAGTYSPPRVESFKQTLLDNGLSIVPNRIEATALDASPAAGETAMANLLARDTHFQTSGRPEFTALVCHNDILAIGAVQKLQQSGVQVPRDVSVTGFDDLSQQYDFQPALTSLDFDRMAMGRRAVQMLCECVEKDEAHGSSFEPQHELFPVQLVVRDSTRAVDVQA